MKIAVDLDDTLSVVDRVTRAQGYIARNKLPYQLVNPEAHRLADVFDWNDGEVLRFMREGGVSVFTEAKVRQGVCEVLSRWREEGHVVIILTARMREMFTNPVNFARDWLQKRRVPYDEIVAECTDKGAYCAEHGIEILVDDSVENCLGAQKHGVTAVLAVSRYTQSRSHEIFFGGANWKQIDLAVQKIIEIRTLERLAAQACVARFREIYDGWELNEDRWEALRGNSVGLVRPSVLDVAQKVRYCEEKYKSKGKPCRFLITPLDLPLDGYLQALGYEEERKCEVMTLDSVSPFAEQGEVYVYRALTSEWLKDCFTVAGTAARRDYTLSGGRTLFVSVYAEGKPVAIATGAVQGKWVGVYDVFTSLGYRDRGYAKLACQRVLSEAHFLGATQAYLQVQESNERAKTLYRSLGFESKHAYWYRVKK